MLTYGQAEELLDLARSFDHKSINAGVGNRAGQDQGAGARARYVQKAVEREINALKVTDEGGRNDQLNRSAFALGQLVASGTLTEARVIAELEAAALDTGLEPSEIRATIHSGLNAGKGAPRDLKNVGTKASNITANAGTSPMKRDAQYESGDGKDQRPPAGTRVVDYVFEAGAELWHDQATTPYLTATVERHQEHYRLSSRAARDYLQVLFYNSEKRALSGQSQGEAVSLLQGLACREGKEYRTAVRLAHLNGLTYLDLGTPDWEVVEVGSGYWKVICPQECPVRFIRPAGLLPLPAPVEGGTLEDLREFLNTDDQGFLMCVAWLLGAASGMSPYPVLALSGEQGTGKSTAASVLRNLLDPHEADRRRTPKEERDLFIAAQASHVLSYDNLSSIPSWLSDALCVLSTGGTFTARTLYSDGEETILKAVRPVLMNGIPDLLARPDLAERALTVTLYRIAQDKRTPERVFWTHYERARPRLLGALLAALAEGLRQLEHTELRQSPRLADFARLIVAAEGALPWQAGAFLEAYGQMQSEAAGTVLDGEPVAEALRALIDGGPNWRGTVKALLSALNGQEGYPDTYRPPQGWPRNPRALGSSLRRLAPALGKTGYVVVPEGRSREGERYHLYKETEPTCTTFTTLMEPPQNQQSRSAHSPARRSLKATNVHPTGQGVNIEGIGVTVGRGDVHRKSVVLDDIDEYDVYDARSFAASDGEPNAGHSEEELIF